MDEYFKSNNLNIDNSPTISVPTAMQLSWTVLTAAFISIVILVICILFSSSKKKIVDFEKQVNLLNYY